MLGKQRFDGLVTHQCLRHLAIYQTGFQLSAVRAAA